MARRRSLGGPLVLIGLGALLLYSSMRANWAPWGVVWRYWPVILIAWGLGKLLDHLRYREQPGAPPPSRFSAGEIAMVGAVVVLVAVAFARRNENPSERQGNYHDTQAVERQGAQTVHAQLELGAGRLELSGGATKLLEADFSYDRPSLKPEVNYSVSGASGDLEIRQPEQNHIHFGTGGRSDWNLRFNNEVPLDLGIEMGAGRGLLRLGGLALSHFSVEGGAGDLQVDLTGGNWTKNLDGRIEGGVGTVVVRVPANVGVRVTASGGLGSVNAPGFERDGDVYTNGAYGKLPVTLELNIEGGVGTIRLESVS
ncbi:MAG TPA: toast rack family protein [Candidatus Acidoferrales bacterium]|nr:toast rack family protein [Candidatus Acidoferrales bacterium]